MNSLTATLYLTVLLSLAPLLAVAQQQVNILNTDRGESGVIDGEPVFKLLGNVHLETEEMELHADSAYQFEELNLIQAFRVQIETENEIIWSDTILHDTESDYSELRGRVIIESEKNTLFSESIDYDRRLDIAIFLDPVRFEDDRGKLIAERGVYFQESDEAWFAGNVQLADSSQYLESDSLFMNREVDFYQMFERVYAIDHDDRISLSGQSLEADSAGYRLLSGDAWMMRYSEAENDTTFLTSGELEIQESDTATFISAIDEVRIWTSNFSAIADTMHYRDDIEQFQLISNPVAWQKSIQLSGPYIEAEMENDEIRMLRSWSRPMIVQEDTTLSRFHQMTGDTLFAWFEEGEIREVVVFDNSEMIRFLKDEDQNPDGLIEMIAAGATRVLFRNGEADSVRVSRNIDGSFLEESSGIAERRLAGFRWEPERRPDRPAMRWPRHPEITDERPFELPALYRLHLQAEGREENEGRRYPPVQPVQPR
ncbi:MAG: OstA-like protein [Balneolaceae bacterium]